jgi:hypothetical protein
MPTQSGNFSLDPHPLTPDQWKAKQGDAASVLQPSDGSIYRRSKDGAWQEKDDAYTKTDKHLDEYRDKREVWDHGVDPDTGLPRTPTPTPTPTPAPTPAHTP